MTRTVFAMGAMSIIYGSAAYFSWLQWGPLDPPSRIVYQHPLFTLVEAKSREQATAYAVRSAQSGAWIYRYQEYCLDRPSLGIVRRQWVGDPTLPVEDKANVGRPGCFARSFREVAPDVRTTRHFSFEMRIDYPNENPLRVASLHYEPIPLTVHP